MSRRPLLESAISRILRSQTSNVLSKIVDGPMFNLDNYLGPHSRVADVKYDEKLTHEAGESAGHWKRSQSIAKLLRTRACEYAEGDHPGGLWMSVELRKMAEEIEGS